MSRSILLIVAIWMVRLVVAAESVRHFNEGNGVPSGHITQMLQDSHGFMWFSTWNGLCRFDGYDFHTFKPVAGDGCHMANDRIRSIALRPDGKIVCKVEESEYYLFDTRTCRYYDVAPDDIQQAAEDIQRYRQSKSVHDDRAISFTFTDRQGNQWLTNSSSISLLRTDVSHTQRLPIAPAAEVKCLFRDSKGRIWLTTREDAAVRIYNADMQLRGYLGRDGAIHASYTSFGAAVYCMYEAADGTLWLGSKPHGLFCLKAARSPGIPEAPFIISQPVEMTNQDVYNIKEDYQGRLWIATMRNGLFYTSDRQHFLVPKHYPRDCGQRVRYLHITPDSILMAAATDGLMVARLEQNVEDMRFLHHRRESDRATSLSSSATMDIIEDACGNILVSTESGGVNKLEHQQSGNLQNSGLLMPQLLFSHINTASRLLPSDIALSMAPMRDGRMIVVSSRLVTILDTAGHSRVLDARYFDADSRFSEARPLLFADGRWLFGLKDGAMITTAEQLLQPSYCPPIVLTHVEVRSKNGEARGEWGAESLDTLVLQPHERNMSIHFAALDFSAPEHISYAFRLSPSDAHLPGLSSHLPSSAEQWNYVGHDRSATLLDLEPGTYCFEVRSTNADGEWQPNARMLTIMVLPTFWEAWYGQLLILLLIIAAMAGIAYTLLYIRRIKRKQRETLEAYLALIEVRGEQPQTTAEPQEVLGEKPDITLQRVMQFIEENISNGSIGVGDMAAAAAVSRSGLQRKLKQAMGITPLDLLREARIKHACQLLQQTDKTIAEIAYASGFTDPKYFSRCFKQSTGKSPSGYREG